jgi:hypothetical protein
MAEPIPRGPFDQGLFLAHYNKGRELFEAQRFDEAERQLEEAYLLRPRDARVLNLLGLVYYRGEKLGKAEEVYRKLIAESPDVHTLHYNLGLVCFKLGRLEDAEAAFQKAVELTQGNPKIHFYLGSIYERMQRYKDAIYQYRQAGANMLVQRLEGRMSGGKPPSTTRPPVPLPPEPVRETDAGTKPPTGKKGVVDTAAAEVAAALDPMVSKTIQPVSPTLMAGDSLVAGDGGTLSPEMRSTRRFKGHDDTVPPALRMAAAQRAAAPGTDTKPGTGNDARPSEVFRALEKGLMEINFSGKVYIKQGTIYSYSGNLTFWVKDKRPGARPSLVIVTGTGRLILTDHERELTFTRVMDEPVYVDPSHLVACEEALQPRYVRLGDEGAGIEVVALEGRGMVALSVASKPLPLGVSPGMPVAVPAHSVIMWTGALVPHVVEDPEIYAVVMAPATGNARMLRLEGTGQILVEQTLG